MILRSIRVEAWRCFVHPTTVGPFAPGLNVLFAPNGTGKSTLFEALVRGLLDNHGVTGREVEALRPWGRALSPAVVIEFAHGGAEYRLAKRFLEKHSELARLEQGQFVPLLKGAEADERVRAMLSRSAPGKGLAQVKHWGLAEVLWAPQGDLRLGRPAHDVVAEIRSALGAQASGGAPGSALEQRVEALYRGFYAPTTGKLRVGREAPPAVRLAAQLEEARARLREASELHAAFAQGAERIEALRTARAAARAAVERLARELAAARARAEAWRAQVADRAEREERARAAAAQQRWLRQQIDSLARARRELDEARARHAALAAELPEAERLARASEREARHEREAAEALRAERRAVEQAVALAEDARRYSELRARATALGERLAHIADVRAALDKRTRARADLAAPDARALEEVRKALGARAEAQLRLDAALVTLEVTPAADGVLEVLAADEPAAPDERAVRAGQTVEVRGSSEVAVRVPGLFAVRVRVPQTETLAALRAERDRAAREAAARTQPYGTQDWDEIVALHDTASALDRLVAQAETQLRTLLGRDDPAALAKQHGRLEAELAALAAARPGWAEVPPDAEALRAEAERARATFEVGERMVEGRRAAAEGGHAAAQSRVAGLSARLEETARAITALEARVAEIEGDGRTDAARREELERVVLEHEGAQARLRQLETEVAAFGADPRPRVSALETELARAEGEATSALEREKSEEGAIEHLASRGPYTLLAQAQEEVARLEADLARARVRAEAVKLLRATVVGCRDEAVAAVAAPVEHAATAMLARIAGGAQLGGVKLGEGFEPARVTPAPAAGEPVALESVSGGEREQIFLATRLALAQVLAREERQLVVLDDVLTATDAARLARVLEVLREAADRLQVLVITCHPERYQPLAGAGARFLDLAAAVQAAAASAAAASAALSVTTAAAGAELPASAAAATSASSAGGAAAPAAPSEPPP